MLRSQLDKGLEASLTGAFESLAVGTEKENWVYSLMDDSLSYFFDAFWLHDSKQRFIRVPQALNRAAKCFEWGGRPSITAKA